MSLVLQRVTAPNDDARILLGELDADLNSSYDPEQRHGLNISRLFQPDILFFTAHLDNAPVGCGGVAFEGDWAEVKRMYVRPQARRRGVAAALLVRLEDEARSRCMARLVLETGDVQHAAIRLYEQAGFTRCPPFGTYSEMGLHEIERSLFFEKWIG